jgi:hypothetical protein
LTDPPPPPSLLPIRRSCIIAHLPFLEDRGECVGEAPKLKQAEGARRQSETKYIDGEDDDDDEDNNDAPDENTHADFIKRRLSVAQPFVDEGEEVRA